MVAVGQVENNVGVGGLCGKEVTVVERAIDEADLGVLCSNLCAFVAVANENGNAKVWVCVCKSIEDIAANVACDAGACELSAGDAA